MSTMPAPELTAWIAALRPLLDAEEIRQYDRQLWIIALDADTSIELEVDAARAQLVLTSLVGRPPAGAEAEYHRFLLGAAADWRETGTRRLSLDLEGQVHQLEDVPLADLTQETLTSRVQAFVADARALRLDLGASPEPAATATAPAPGLLRV